MGDFDEMKESFRIQGNLRFEEKEMKNICSRLCEATGLSAQSLKNKVILELRILEGSSKE